MLAKLRVIRLFGRYTRFCVVGGTGLVVDMSVFYILTDPARLGWSLSISKLIAAEVAMLNNFIWNDVWTFRDLRLLRNDLSHRLYRYIRFNVICSSGLLLGVLLLKLQVVLLGVQPYVANLLAILAVSLWNFFLTLRFGWTHDAARRPTASSPV